VPREQIRIHRRQARLGRNDALGGWRSIFNDRGFEPRGRIAVEEARGVAIDTKGVVSVNILWFPFLIKPAGMLLT
jgi:hypothetical protein